MKRLQQTDTLTLTCPVAYVTVPRFTKAWMTNLHQSSLEHMIPDYLKVENIIILIGMIIVT